MGFSKFRTAAFRDDLYRLWRQGLTAGLITRALKAKGDKCALGTISKALKTCRAEFLARAEADDKAEQSAVRALEAGENPKLHLAIVSLDSAVLEELAKRVDDMKDGDLIALANGLVGRHLLAVLQAAGRSLSAATSAKIQALALGNLIVNGGGGSAGALEMSDARVEKVLEGHEAGDLLKREPEAGRLLKKERHKDTKALREK